MKKTKIYLLIKAFFIIIMLAFYTPYGICAGKSKNSVSKKYFPAKFNRFELSKFQSTFAYWNDNFLLDDITGLKNKKNSDDFETGNFLYQIIYQSGKNSIILDNYFNILTNKKDDYRVDIFASRLSMERKIPTGLAELGGGFVASGDFGGSDIQNGYHNVFGYVPVHLPYTKKNELGLVFITKYKPSFYSGKNIKINGYLSNYYRTGIIPNNLRTGLDLNGYKHFRSKKKFVHSQLILGYTEYYNTEKMMGPLFGNGFTWGMLVSGGLNNYLVPALWLTNNQYGIKRLQFGISMSFGWNGKRMYDLNDFTFP